MSGETGKGGESAASAVTGMARGVAELVQAAAGEAVDFWQKTASGVALRGARLTLDVWRSVPGLPEMVKSALEEYRHDLESVPESSLQLGGASLASLLSKGLLDEWEGPQKAAARRLLGALAVKLRHGPEHFAEPGSAGVAPTPRRRVHKVGRVELFRYEPPLPLPPRASGRPPVLIVYSVVNRSYILDLMEEFSFVRHLLAEGLDVYLVEWGETVRWDRETTLDSHVLAVGSCVDAIRRLTGEPRVALFGHCLGGVLSLMYAALEPEKVSRLLALTTPLSAAEGGIVALWTNKALFPVDLLVDAFGCMPGKLIRTTFLMLKPYYEVMRWRVFLDTLPSEPAQKLFASVDCWLNDNPDVPGEVYRKLMHELYLEGRFARGETEIGGTKVDLARITCPVLNVVAEKDWIVPPASARPLGKLVGSRDYRYLELPGFHVSMMVDPRLRSGWRQMSDFLREKPEREGDGKPVRKAARKAARKAGPRVSAPSGRASVEGSDPSRPASTARPARRAAPSGAPRSAAAPPPPKGRPGV